MNTERSVHYAPNAEIALTCKFNESHRVYKLN